VKIIGEAITFAFRTVRLTFRHRPADQTLHQTVRPLPLASRGLTIGGR
jgi:hypothetical protein